MRRKIFQIIECGGPGGTGFQVAAVCNHLNPSVFETVLVYSVRPGSSPEEYRALASGAERAFHIPEMTRTAFSSANLKALQSLYRLFKAERPDVVHAHSSIAGALARPAARLAGIPRIYYSPHGYSFQMRDASALGRCAYRAIEKGLSRIGTTVAVSPSEAELARSLCGRKPVQTVCDAYLGALPSIRERREKPLRITACGRMTYARYPEAYVKLAQRVTDSRNDVHFTWIGDGELRPVVEEMTTDMNLKSRFEITGWLSREDVRTRLAGTDIFVHFSRWEGLPNAVLEAMAYGLPVVASNIPGNRDAVAHGKTGYLANSEIEMLERVLELVDDPELRHKMGASGRQRIEAEFTLDKTIAALEKLYLTP